MDVLFTLVSVVLLAMPVVLMAGWLIGSGIGPLGSLIATTDPGDWQVALTWPTGVQEEEAVSWGTRPVDELAPESDEEAALAIVRRARLEGLYVPPTRPQTHVRSR